ncbi:MAG TPA: AraC family transcriptional regulator ligand-binding domain-containing protein [Polyangiaceae bacterium]|jgi:AraC-like DNA-binding protein|nr:AraC family transcriptional regulator ligand-binding domain-containing protein [Polyangiaceae bacterium]
MDRKALASDHHDLRHRVLQADDGSIPPSSDMSPPLRSRVRLGSPRPPKPVPAGELSYSFRVVRPFMRALRGAPHIPAEALASIDALEPDDRIAISIAHQMLDAALLWTGDVDLGLKAARECTRGEAGALDYAVMSASTGFDAITAASRFIRLVNDALDIRIETKGERVLARLENCVPLNRQAADFQMGGLYGVLAAAWGAPDSARVTVMLAHPMPADITEYQRTFVGAKLAFGTPSYGFEFDAELLRAPLRSADANLHDLMRRHAERVLSELPQALPITRRVKGLIVEELADGHPGCAHIAQRLQMSPRTLERRLELEGTTFTRLLEEVREGLALRYVGDQELPLSQVATQLGFSQTTAFHRAFRRWTGQTPLQYRRSTRAPTEG